MKDFDILLVEDNQIIKKVMDRFLTKLNYQPDCVTSIDEALVCVAKKDYDLIITDIGLPDGDGVSLIHTIRAIEKDINRSAAYICAATAYRIEEIRESSLKAGANDVVAKPLSLYFLRHLISKAKDFVPPASDY